MTGALGLSSQALAAIAAICFAAGIVRGFAGFALSALVMATAVSFLPPVELIPVLWWLELAASVIMLRGGFRDADRRAAYTLSAGSYLGWPLGLWLTTTLPVATSKTVALGLVVGLSVSQLARLRLAFLASPSGTFFAGFLAGIVSGLAHIGGMVVALYVLARNDPARSMRGTLVLFLFLGSLGSLVFLLSFGVMDKTTALRALVLIAPTALGVWLGQRLFIPRWERYYRPFCLSLLIALAAFSLIRHLT